MDKRTLQFRGGMLVNLSFLCALAVILAKVWVADDGVLINSTIEHAVWTADLQYGDLCPGWGARQPHNRELFQRYMLLALRKAKAQDGDVLLMFVSKSTGRQYHHARQTTKLPYHPRRRPGVF